MSPSITISNNPSFSYTHRQIAKRSVSFPACGASLGALQGAKWGSKSWVDRGPQQPLPSSRTTKEGRVRNATHTASGMLARMQAGLERRQFHERIQIFTTLRRTSNAVVKLGCLASFVALSTGLWVSLAVDAVTERLTFVLRTRDT